MPANQNLVLIEGAATYERILAAVRDVDLDEGIRHIKDYLKIYPEFAQAHNDLAVLYYHSGNPLKALAHHEKSHKLDPGNITYRKNLADFYFVELEWTDDAVHTYLDILKDNPFDTEALNALGTISLQLGRRQQAQQYFCRTLQLDSNNHEARQSLQELALPQTVSPNFNQISQGFSPAGPELKPETCAPAESSFQNMFGTVQAETARSPEDLYQEAMRLVNTDKSEEAIRLLETLMAQNADHALAHNDLGVLYQRKGDIRNSRHHHEEAVRLQPTNDVFQKNLADLLCMEFEALEEALAIYVKLLAGNQYDVELLKAIAYVCAEVGKKEDARFFLNQIINIKPWDQDAVEALRANETTNSRSV